MKAAEGTEVGIYVDLAAPVAPGDAIVTPSGRAYMVVAVRVQERGKHAGRQHVRGIVTHESRVPFGIQVHRIRWYPRPRGKRALTPRSVRDTLK